jgi:trigger factor
MKVDVDIVNPVQRKIRVELPPETVSREFSQAYGRLVRRARIKGFRPGKVPRQVLEGIYRDEVRGEVLTHLVETSLQKIFRERGLSAVSRPQIEADDLADGESFIFSAVVEVKPDFNVEDYIGMELEKVKIAVTDQEVEKALLRLQDQHAHLEPVEESHDTVQRGDFVLLDFLGSVAGKPIPEGRAENYLLEVGAGSALPEFEKALVGMAKEAPQTISVTYPEEYPNRDLAGQTANFSVTLREIKKKVRPALDDDFAKDVGECSILDELRAKIRARLEDQVGELQNRELKEQLVGRLLEAHPFDVPQGLVERQLRYLSDRRSNRSPSSPMQESQDSSSAEILRRELEPQAAKQVRAMLLVEKIADREKISAGDAELQQRIGEIARASGEHAGEVRKLYDHESAREELRSQMIFDRTLDFLIAHAKVKEIEPPKVDEGDKKS